MIKFTASLNQGTLYGFGLTEANLNRMQFNNEPIFFDFGYANHPQLFGLILYLDKFKEPLDIAKNIDAVKVLCLPYFNLERSVTPETLHFFPIAQSVMQKFRKVPFWGFNTNTEITSPHDQQLFFAGKDESAIEKYFQANGFISPKTKRTHKGFGG